jgi:hypothetical protein
MNDLHFDASRPVEGDLFVNRVAELRRLDGALNKLRAGRADYLSVMGLRKQGKSSLFQGWHAALAFDLDGAVSIHALDRGAKTKRGRRYSEDTALRHILDVLQPEPSS